MSSFHVHVHKINIYNIFSLHVWGDAPPEKEPCEGIPLESLPVFFSLSLSDRTRHDGAFHYCCSVHEDHPVSHSGPDYSTSDSITSVYPNLQGFKKHVKFHILLFSFGRLTRTVYGTCFKAKDHNQVPLIIAKDFWSMIRFLFWKFPGNIFC